MDPYKGRKAQTQSYQLAKNAILSEVSKNLLIFSFLLSGPCPHHSIPVEMGETLDLERLPPCEQCNAHTETVKRLEAREFEPPQRAAQQVGLSKFPENQYKHQFRINSPAAPLSGHVNAPFMEDFWHVSLRQKVQYKQDPIGPSSQHRSHSVDNAEYLEPPQPLKSDFNSINYVKMPIPHMPCEYVSELPLDCFI